MKRAERRHHADRMKAKAKRVRPWDSTATHKADHLAICSCSMCGNPRRHFKGKDRITIQERKIKDALP
jgi:hypothetical protein